MEFLNLLFGIIVRIFGIMFFIFLIYAMLKTTIEENIKSKKRKDLLQRIEEERKELSKEISKIFEELEEAQKKEKENNKKKKENK